MQRVLLGARAMSFGLFSHGECVPPATWSLRSGFFRTLRVWHLAGFPRGEGFLELSRIRFPDIRLFWDQYTGLGDHFG